VNRRRSSSVPRPGPAARTELSERSDPNPLTPTLPENGRDAAIRHLSRLASKYPDVMPLPLVTEGLDGRESALAHAIVDHAVRRWITIEHLVRVCAMREPSELEPRLRAAILSGAVQLLFLDRVPTHAAIDETVEWAKQKVRPGAAGITNAILRRIATIRLADPVGERTLRDRSRNERDELPLSDGRALALSAPALPSDSIDRAAIASGTPAPLVARWAGAFGPDRATQIALHGIIEAPTIINASATSRVPSGPDLTAHQKPGFLVFSGSRERLGAILGSENRCWVQDPASAEAVESLSDLRPRVIADVCAGRGTKTRQLARRFPDAEIIASDTDPARMADLRRLAGVEQRVRVVEPRELVGVCAERVDLLLLDVPCSNTGVLARRPEARHRFGTDQFERLGRVQRQIFADAIRLRAPRGRVIYSTCSLEADENAAMVEWAARWHGLRVVASRTTLPAGLPGEPAASYTDGSFWALLDG
jgi:16S rRNA (cytosine967-C5)-methyltransferase